MQNAKSIISDQNNINSNETGLLFGGEEITLTKRLGSLRKNQSKPIVLHRKTFFDETQERLIIVSIVIDSVIEKKRTSSAYGNQRV